MRKLTMLVRGPANIWGRGQEGEYGRLNKKMNARKVSARHVLEKAGANRDPPLVSVLYMMG